MLIGARILFFSQSNPISQVQLFQDFYARPNIGHKQGPDLSYQADTSASRNSRSFIGSGLMPGAPDQQQLEKIMIYPGGGKP